MPEKTTTQGKAAGQTGVVDVVEQLRSGIGHSVLALVAGPDGAEQHVRIFDTAGPRWFPPGAPIRRVHGDVSMYLGGLRALLLQSLHPVAVTAVSEHSSYRENIWARVAGTGRFVATTTFGTIDDAEAAIARVRAIHNDIRGTMPDGTPYCAGDPHLLEWVHAAETDSFLVAYQRFGAGSLTAEEADEYVRQAGQINEKLGTGTLPKSVEELRATIEAFRRELECTHAAREAVRRLLFAPLPWAGRLPYAAIGAAAVASLPAWALRMFGLPAIPVVGSLALAPAGYLGGRSVTATLRWLIRPLADAAPDGPATDPG